MEVQLESTCVCACVCENVYVLIFLLCAQIHGHKRGVNLCVWEPKEIRSQSLSIHSSMITILILDIGFLTSIELTDMVGLSIQQMQGSDWLCLPSAGIIVIGLTGIFYMDTGDGTWLHVLAR